MPFDKFMESFDPTAEDFDPAAFKEAAIAEYRTDLGALQETANAKITSITTERDSLAEKVTRVQSHNYDLIQAAGGKPAGDASGTAGDTGTGSAPRSFDSLFKKE